MHARITAIAPDAFTCALVAPTGRVVYQATRHTAKRAFNAAVAGSRLNVRLCAGVPFREPTWMHVVTLPLTFVVAPEHEGVQ